MIARALPERTCCMSSLTGAALTWLRVNTAATAAGTSETISARSLLPDGLMPAAMPSARKPWAAVTLEEAESFFIATNQIHTLHGLTGRAFGEVVDYRDDDEPVRALVEAGADVAEVGHLDVLGVRQRIGDADEPFVPV